MTLTPGTRLGPYEIVALLGAGGMGEVYRARDPRLGRDVAIKVLPQHLSANPEVRARFEREARTVSSLNHPNICTLFDVGREADTDYLVMELVEGETLAQRIEKGALPLVETLKLAAQIAEALDRAHRAGVIHRDLKPGNVMLTKSGAKLMDFGLARSSGLAGPASGSAAMVAALTRSPTIAAPLTAEGTIVGTFQYMAPEQLEGREADTRSDLWALGCVMYEMITGRRAFDGKSQASLITAIMGSEPAPISQITSLAPPALERLVGACLAKDPADRVQSAHDIKLQLQWLAAGDSQSGAAAASAVFSPKRALGKWLLPALVGVLLLGAAAGYLARDRSAPKSVGIADVRYQAVTFEEGFVYGARFAPDGRTIVYSADWHGRERDVFVTSLDRPDFRPLGFAGSDLLAISRTGELAIMLHSALPEGGAWGRVGTLARASVNGGAARSELESVRFADIAPDGATAVVRLGQRSVTLEYPVGKVLAENPVINRGITGTAGFFNPRISPSGQHVAFYERRGADTLFVRIVDRSGKTVARSPLLADWWGIAWSPRGEVWYGMNDVVGVGTFLKTLDLHGQSRVVHSSPVTLTLHDISAQGDVLASIDRQPSHVELVAAGGGAPQDRSWRSAADLAAFSASHILLLSQFGESGGPKGSVYVWEPGNAQPVRIADGQGLALSPDGRQALVVSTAAPIRVSVVPTGAGQPRVLDLGPIVRVTWAGWRPDGSLLIEAVRPGLKSEVLALSPDGRQLASSLPQGMTFRGDNLISPDGARVVAHDANGRAMLCTIAGGDSVPLAGARELDHFAGWTADGKSVYVYQQQSTPVQVERLDVATGTRSPWRTISPLRARVTGLPTLIVSPDGAVAYGYQSHKSEMFVIRGLK